MIAQWPLSLTPSSCGKSRPPPAALLYWTSERSKPTLRGVELVVAGDRHQRVVGQQLGDELAERGVEGGAAAGGVGEERAAARARGAGGARRGPPSANDERRAAVDVDQRVVDQVRVAREELLVVDHDVEVQRRLARACPSGWGSPAGRRSSRRRAELGDLQGAPLGRLRPEVADLADGQLVGGHLAAGGVVDHVLADLDAP